MQKIIYLYFSIINFISKFWNKIEHKFGIPNTPKALPIRLFSEENSYCWEDFYKESKEKYPMRFFIFHDCKRFISRFFVRFIQNPLLWFDSRFIKKDHILDLRGSLILDYRKVYTGGYADPCSVLEMSIFKVFERYKKELEDQDGFIIDQISRLEFYYNSPDTSKFELPCIAKQIQFLKRISEIEYFFYIDLPNMVAEKEKARAEYYSLNKSERNIKSKLIESLEEAMEMRLTEVLCDIINIRKGMWT